MREVTNALYSLSINAAERCQRDPSFRSMMRDLATGNGDKQGFLRLLESTAEKPSDPVKQKLSEAHLFDNNEFFTSWVKMINIWSSSLPEEVTSKEAKPFIEEQLRVKRVLQILDAGGELNEDRDRYADVAKRLRPFISMD